MRVIDADKMASILDKYEGYYKGQAESHIKANGDLCLHFTAVAAAIRTLSIAVRDATIEIQPEKKKGERKRDDEMYRRCYRHDGERNPDGSYGKVYFT